MILQVQVSPLNILRTWLRSDQYRGTLYFWHRLYIFITNLISILNSFIINRYLVASFIQNKLKWIWIIWNTLTSWSQEKGEVSKSNNFISHITTIDCLYHKFYPSCRIKWTFGNNQGIRPNFKPEIKILNQLRWTSEIGKELLSLNNFSLIISRQPSRHNSCYRDAIW